MYIYRLGHCTELARAELGALGVLVKYVSQKLAFSSQKLDVNLTGSIVFRASHIYSFPQAPHFGELGEILADYLQKNPTKKLGFCAPKALHGGMMQLAKKLGVKKVNVIDKPEPNFGDYKQSKQWIWMYTHQDATHVALIDQFANQEFWAELDMKMPHRDMKRGIINLKLARSLYNLAGRPKVWYDPFVGQGRMVTATADNTSEFFGSDIDATVLDNARENTEFALRYWHQKGRFITPEPAHIATQFSLFTRDISAPADRIISATVVVSEGFLGKTFAYTPHSGEIEYELFGLKKMWKSAFNELSKQHIATIVCCLPYYPKNEEYGIEFYEKILQETLTESGSNFTIVPLLDDKNTIGYTRTESNAGHLIFKVTSAPQG